MLVRTNIMANLGVVCKVGVVWEWSAKVGVVSHVESHISKTSSYT
jgi:hypothetical protein